MLSVQVIKDYQDYILEHRRGVVKVWEDIFKPILIQERYSDSIITKISELVRVHDEDKIRDPEICHPYAAYFHDKVKYPKNEIYKRAWNKHQKQSPHHWQYWVLLEDECDPKIHALEMPLWYVIEMLCDRQSASNHYGNTAHWWYESQKDNMILNPTTCKLVEYYLDYLD